MEKSYQYDVFLSFSKKDKNFAKTIWERLTASGLKVFFSDESLKKSIGFDFEDEIESALKQSKNFVLICTPNAMKSRWVKREYRAFNKQLDEKTEKERRFIILEGKRFTPSLIPLMISTLQTAKSVDEIIEIIADKTVSTTGDQNELVTRKPGETSTSQKSSAIKTHKINKVKKGIKAAVILMGLVASIITFMIIANNIFKPSKNKITQKDETVNKKEEKQDIFSTEDTEDKVRELMAELTKPGKVLSSKPKGQKIYVTQLSFMDAQILFPMVQKDMAASINEAVDKGMNLGKEANNDLEINASGHEIPNTDANVDKLVNIVFDPYLTMSIRIQRVIREIMDPHQVDVIVTGYYIDNARNPMIIVRPLVIVKSLKKIITKNLQFKKEELVCKDPISKKIILCKEAFNQIVQAVKEILEQV